MTGRRTAVQPVGVRDEGVSSVLGAILVFGLLILTLVMVQVRFVPVWDRNKEADHMQALGNQLGVLKSDLDRMADNRTAVPLADPITLRVEQGFRFFQGTRLPSDLSLVPAATGAGLRVATNQAHLLRQNGQAIFAGSEAWAPVATGDTLTNVGSVQNLRVRIGTPAAWSTGDSINLVITNATGAYAGKFVITNYHHGETFTMRYETYAAGSTTVPTSLWSEDHDKGNPPAYLYIDLLEQRYQFNQVLAGSSSPSTVTLNRNNLNAEYTASYTAVTAGGGSTTVGGGGTLVPGFARGLQSGSLVVNSRNQQFPQQTYTVEHGAVILTQPDGDVMYIAPSFTATQVAGVVDIRWVVPGIQGAATTITGPATATLAVSPGTPTSFLATMPRMDVTLTTLHGPVWAQFFTSTLQAAGLTYGTQFTVASNTTAASLTVFGQQTAPGSTVDDITLTFQGAAINVTPRAGA